MGKDSSFNERSSLNGYSHTYIWKHMIFYFQKCVWLNQLHWAFLRNIWCQSYKPFFFCSIASSMCFPNSLRSASIGDTNGYHHSKDCFTSDTLPAL